MGLISYRFRDRRRFQSKIENFPTSLYFEPPLKRFPLELGTAAGGEKTRMTGLPGRQRNLTISSADWIQSTNVTDGRTPGDSEDRAYAQRLAVKTVTFLPNIAYIHH